MIHLSVSHVRAWRHRAQLVKEDLGGRGRKGRFVGNPGKEGEEELD